MTDCQLGHTDHEVITVPTRVGPMRVYNSAPYMDIAEPGLCPARHAVCDRLRAEGSWEAHDTTVIRSILEVGNRDKIVVDFGANCGWYTLLAAGYGYRVVAVEYEDAFIELLHENVALNHVQDRVTIIQAWVDEAFTLSDPGVDVELIKVDLEGADKFAVEACWPWVNRVNGWWIEISPEFRDDYPHLVNRLTGIGFAARYPDGREFDGDYRHQLNLWFSR